MYLTCSGPAGLFEAMPPIPDEIIGMILTEVRCCASAVSDTVGFKQNVMLIPLFSYVTYRTRPFSAPHLRIANSTSFLNATYGGTS